jgi:hypothetical protein
MKIESLSLAVLLSLAWSGVTLAQTSESSADENIEIIAQSIGESEEDYMETQDDASVDLRSNLNCSTKVYNTAATATCTGSGTWRLRIDCQAQPDYVGGWNYQTGGTLKKGGECRFKARGATVESK